VADVALDDERAPYIPQMFELYATGRYGYYDIQQIMTERGLRTKPTARFPKPGIVSIHSIGRILRDHYYCGWVTKDGVEYPGRHPKLVTEEVFQRVQQVLDSERGGGTRNRVHKHHLKGRLWCGRCGKRFLIAKANGNGGTYFYFFCIGRQDKSCDMPYLPIVGKDGVEAAVSRQYAGITLDSDFCAEVGGMAEAALADELHTNEHLRENLENRLAKLDAKETALIGYIGEPDWPQAKLNAAMQSVRQEQEGIQKQLADVHAALDAGREVLLLGVKMLATPRLVYDTGSDVVRGILTKGIFTKIYVEADEERRASVTRHELTEPFDALVWAQEVWRGQQAGSPTPEAVHRRTAASDSNRGHHSPEGVAASVDLRTADLLASVFEDCGSSKAMLVGVVEALAHPSQPVRRLLDLAKTWPDGLQGDGAAPTACRTARQLRPIEIDELVTRYTAGATVYDLADRFSISRATVGQYLRGCGVDTKPPGLHPDDVPAAAKLYEGGWSLARIAGKFDTSPNTVRARLLETGVRMRDTQGLTR
jgi:Recombinase/Recombinase zinc beta ribbon domain/Helix-turn-helix domain of resolvase